MNTNQNTNDSSVQGWTGSQIEPATSMPSPDKETYKREVHELAHYLEYTQSELEQTQHNAEAVILKERNEAMERARAIVLDKNERFKQAAEEKDRLFKNAVRQHEQATSDNTQAELATSRMNIIAEANDALRQKDDMLNTAAETVHSLQSSLDNLREEESLKTNIAAADKRNVITEAEELLNQQREQIVTEAEVSFQAQAEQAGSIQSDLRLQIAHLEGELLIAKNNAEGSDVELHLATQKLEAAEGNLRRAKEHYIAELHEVKTANANLASQYKNLETELLTTKQTQFQTSLNLAEDVQEKETQHNEMKILLDQVVKANEDLKSRCDSLSEDRLKLTKELMQAKNNASTTILPLSDELTSCKIKLAETQKQREEEFLKYKEKVRDLEHQVITLQADLKKDGDAREYVRLCKINEGDEYEEDESQDPHNPKKHRSGTATPSGSVASERGRDHDSKKRDCEGKLEIESWPSITGFRLWLLRFKRKAAAISRRPKLAYEWLTAIETKTFEELAIANLSMSLMRGWGQLLITLSRANSKEKFKSKRKNSLKTAS